MGEDIKVHPAGTFLYVANQFDDTLSIIDLSTNTVTNTMALADEPWDRAVSQGEFKPPPTANAGPDDMVNEGDSLALNGTGSNDPQGLPLTYSWTQLAGQAVNLDDPASPTPSFTAPYVSANETLTFKLIVSTDAGTSDPDTVDITIKQVNNPPVADAGDDATIKEDGTAVLDGSNSYDPDTDPITEYEWIQVGGPAVVPDVTDPVHPTFPATAVVGTDYIFNLRVSDGKESSVPSDGTDSSVADTVRVTVVLNSAPTAEAGPDDVVDEGMMYALIGSGTDSDGDPIAFSWSQLSGPTANLVNPNSANASFTAPYVSSGGENVVFELRVDDNDSINPLFGTDQVTIHVSNINDPPTCALASPSQDSLWPPNHKMKQISIVGVMDADAAYNTVTLDVTSVTQDEPVNGLGDGDSNPDAVIQHDSVEDTILIRAERSGTGNGRVYQINFTASDGAESCQGTVQMSVPHSRKSTAVDDGQVYDATQP